MLSAIVRLTDLMSRQIIRVDISATVIQAVSKMIENYVGCVVVTRGGYVVGLIASTDIIERNL